MVSGWQTVPQLIPFPCMGRVSVQSALSHALQGWVRGIRVPHEKEPEDLPVVSSG